MSWKLKEKARILLSEERGTVYKSAGGKISVALIYPNTYHVGMSNLGFLAIYYYLNAHPFILCERAFLPNPEDLPEYQRTQSPLFSLESGRPLSSFDVLAFSVSYENDYLNVLKILDLSQVPLLAEQRTPNDPLIFMGGICALSNPEPLADFVDLVFLGEGEDTFPQIIERFQVQNFGSEGGRETFLAEVAQVEGVYVPRFYHFSYDKGGFLQGLDVEPPAPPRVRKHHVRDVDRYPILGYVRTPHTEFGDMLLLEINRGCKRSCRFCLTGEVYRPFRFRSKEVLLHSVRDHALPSEKIGLVGACISDHPEIEDLCKDLLENGYLLSASSLRVGSLSDRLLALLAQSGQKTITLAPEASSERLRSLLGKPLSEAELYSTIEAIQKHGIPNLRFYFMVGLPTEREEEIEGIAAIAKKAKHLMLAASKDSRRLGQITLSVNAFVPKPWTPFQWLGLEEVGRLQQKLGRVKKALQGIGNIACFHDQPQWAYIQALLARGDRRVGELLLLVLRLGGQWKRAAREWNFNPDFYVYRSRPMQEVFPWDHLDVGVRKEELLEEFQRASLS
jgi:radical SAM superfamily enzyme YgiQ (UPF0313 family)